MLRDNDARKTKSVECIWSLDTNTLRLGPFGMCLHHIGRRQAQGHQPTSIVIITISTISSEEILTPTPRIAFPR